MARKGIEIRMSSILSEIPDEVRRGCLSVLSNAVADIEAQAEAAITTGPKTGRLYERGEVQVTFKTRGRGGEEKEVSFLARAGKASNVHQASAPGEAPANDEGVLANSIASSTRISGQLIGKVIVGAAHGPPLEFGTEDGRIAPRPFLAPAVALVEPVFLQALEHELRKALR